MTTAEGERPGRRGEALGRLVLTALLAVLGPLFVRMPLTADSSFYDSCARHVLRGGALERDLVILFPPGMVWSLAGARALLGGSSEAARVADLLVVGGVIALLALWLRAAGLSRAARLGAAAVLAAFYLTATEWVHCQPDVWMLLPALAALHLRRRQAAALAEPQASAGRAFARAVLEGAFWGTACLFKPFVVVPGAAAWLTAALLLRRSPGGWLRRLVPDALGLLVGGLLVGALWQGWLVQSGSWAEYWHNCRDYQADYYSRTLPWKTRLGEMFTRLPPWSLANVPAFLLAFAFLGRAASRRRPGSEGRVDACALLAAFSLGWTAQANFLQSQLNYHMASALLPALALVAAGAGGPGVPRAAWVAFLVCALLALGAQRAVRPARLALWDRCWTDGDSPELRDRLALDAGLFWTPEWVRLDEVADYLRAQGVGHGELTCFSASTVHLHPHLNVEPASRFLYPSVFFGMFPGHRARILDELRHAPHRFIVTDEVERALASPEIQADFPYGEPVVFEAGRYRVHRPSRAPVETAPAPRR